MIAPTRQLLSILASILALPIAGTAVAGPLDDLLPPQTRQVEKRSLGGDDRGRRAYFDGRGALGGAAFSPDGKFLVTSAGYQGMTLWDVGTGKVLGQLLSQSNAEGLAAAFTADGKQLIAASANRGDSCPVGLWDVAKRERLRSLDEDVNDTPVTALAMAPDGKTLALAGAWGRKNQATTIFYWDLASGDEIGRIDGLVAVDPAAARRGAPPAFGALAYSPDGRSLAALLDGRILLIEVATGKLRTEFQFTIPAESRPERQGAQTGALAFAAEGRILLAGATDGAIHRFDLRSGRELTPLPGHAGGVTALCCTTDGKSIHSCGVDSQLSVWRADAGRDWKPTSGPLTDEALGVLWDVLRSDDPVDLFGSVQTLAASPRQSVPFLTKRLSAVPKEDTERIDRLVEDVKSPEYNTRKKAVVELRKIGAEAAPSLRRAIQKVGYEPTMQRMLNDFSNQAAAPEQVRAARGVAVLEQIGDSDARKLLEQLAGGSAEAPLTVRAKAALDRLGKPETPKEGPAPEALWQALAGDDSAEAFRALRSLANLPAAPTLLRDRLKAIAAKDIFDDDPKRVAKLISDLDSGEFQVREQASKDLRNLGRTVVPALRKALDGKPGPEVARRLEELIDECAKGGPSTEALRVGRALEALELTGGSEARQALEALSKDAKVKWMREAAVAALGRQRPK